MEEVEVSDQACMVAIVIMDMGKAKVLVFNILIIDIMTILVDYYSKIVVMPETFVTFIIIYNYGNNKSRMKNHEMKVENNNILT